MNIRDIPPSHDDFERWSLEHERTAFAYSDADKRVATATRELFVSWAPRPLHGIVRTAIHSLLDDTMRPCFGFPAAPKAMTTAVTGALRARGRLLRLFPGHQRKQFITTKPQRSWPKGYAISDLGPPPLITAEKERLTGD